MTLRTTSKRPHFLSQFTVTVSRSKMTVPLLFLPSQLSNTPPSHPCSFSTDGLTEKTGAVGRELSLLPWTNTATHPHAPTLPSPLLRRTHRAPCLHRPALLLMQGCALTTIPSTTLRLTRPACTPTSCYLPADRNTTWVTNTYLTSNVYKAGFSTPCPALPAIFPGSVTPIGPPSTLQLDLKP